MPVQLPLQGTLKLARKISAENKERFRRATVLFHEHRQRDDVY